MALGTLDRTPPPFFRQGPSALTKLDVLLGAGAVPDGGRHALSAITQPLRAAAGDACCTRSQRTLLMPVELIARRRATTSAGCSAALEAEEAARIELARQSERATRAEQLRRRTRGCAPCSSCGRRLNVRSQAAEVLYEAADPYSRKVIIDRGVDATASRPARRSINEAGVLGQVTRVYLLSAEVTLLTDKDAAIPVLNSRTQARSAAFGGDPAAPAWSCASWPATPTCRSATC